MSNEITGKSLTYIELDQDVYRLTEFETVVASDPVILEVTATAIDTVDRQTYTFNDLSTGDVKPGRKLILAVMASNGSGVLCSPNSVKINGQSLLQLNRRNTGTGNSRFAAIYGIENAVSQLADVEIVFSSTQLRCSVVLYALHNAKNLLPKSAPTAQLNSGSAGPFNVSFTVPAYGAAIAVAHLIATTATATWVNFTERFDPGPANEAGHTVADTARTTTATFNAQLTASTALTDNSPFVGAVWAPKVDPVSPLHWAKFWSANLTFNGVIDADLPSGKGLRVEKITDTANGLLTWDAVPGIKNVSAVALFNFKSSPEGGLILRGSGATATPTAYRARITSTGLTIDKATGGAFSPLNTLVQSFGTQENIWLRFDAIDISGGVTLRAKVWTGELKNEPIAFSLSVDDTSSPITNAGKVGLYISTNGSFYHCGHFHVRSMLNSLTETVRFAASTDYLPPEPYAIPSMLTARVVPAEVSLGESLGKRAQITVTFKDHKHADLGELFDRGTYWGKWRGRSLFRRGNALRILHGLLGQGLSEFDTRHFVLEGFNGPTPSGTFDLIGQDILKLADNDRSQCPRVSNGFLSADLAANGTSFTVLPSGIGAEYPSSGYVAIGGEEIVAFTRTGDTFNVTGGVAGRGQFGTTAVAHNDEDRVQICQYFEAQSPALIIYTLLTEFAGIAPSYIPLTEWESEVSTYLQRLYTRIIAEPTGVNQLITELIVQAGLAVWPDNKENLIKLQVIRGVPSTAFSYHQGNILKESLSVSEQLNKRITQVWTYYGVRNPLQSLTEPNNYRSTIATIDTETETENGEAIIKKIFGTWIPAFGRSTADRVNDLHLARFARPPRKIQFDVMRYSGIQEPLPGSGYRLSWKGNQDASGNEVDTSIQVTRVEPLSDRWKVDAEEVLYTPVSAADLLNRVITIDSNINNVNLRTLHDQIFPAITEDDLGSENVTIRCIINPGVVVGSNDASMPSFDVGDWDLLPPITIEVIGRVQGKGGDGGRGRNNFQPSSLDDGEDGGIALYTRVPITLIDENGEIWGGGGGGQGGITVDGFAGGGGGGAGTIPGAGGAAYNSSTENGEPGTSEAGGARGNTSGSGFRSATNGGGPGLNASGEDGGSAGAAIDGISFVTQFGPTGDRRGPEIN